MAINIVLDIDKVLVCAQVENVQQALFFQNTGAIITAIKTYYVFPGVIEFITLLFQTENINVSFYSAGIKERNVLLVKSLLKLAFPKPKYKQIKKQTRILSRNDLVLANIEKSMAYATFYGLPTIGRKQKDLSKVLTEEDSLEQTILIDDDPCYIAYGQARNILLAPVSSNENFKKLSNKYYFYDKNGYKSLMCTVASEDAYREINEISVKKEKHILLQKREQNFELCFINKESRLYQTCLIDANTDKALLEKLHELHQANLDSNKAACVIKDLQLIEAIHVLVRSYGGITKKICRRANRIYYIVGLLFEALEDSQMTQQSISDCLFTRQYKLATGGERYVNNFTHSRKLESLYFLGLKKLREINAQLQFTTPHSYVKCIQLPITFSEGTALQQFIDNQQALS